ncbi:Hypothetical protein NCS54_01340600 [Fusarium falciforme]|uniref:Hypothetical protein n=1 Tax=Fusarium falciforme TaxID=195108 RepID=UPI0022FFC48E|nr:Hypothetical protein NCS54_01340600 [Fusarium falciforme]WAO95765.1 Hypothetical protein NCS54_01340600 [Fusarium falciforme]
MVDNRGPQLEGVIALFLVTSIVCVGLRTYVRAAMLRSFNLDDYLAVGTLIFFIIFCGFALQAIHFGAGRRLSAVQKQHVPKILKCRWFGEFFYVITSVLVKYTAGIFLLRIISDRWQKMLIWTVLGVILVFNIFYLSIVVFQCSPPNYYWTRFVASGRGHCLPKPFISNTAYVGSAINAWADWMLGLLPIYVVWKLTLKIRDKLLVAGILALGSIPGGALDTDYWISACCATIVRMVYVWQLTDAEDFLYEFTDIAIWSTVENGLGLTAVCMATLRPLIRSLKSLYRGNSNEAHPTQNGTINLSRTVFQHRGLPIDSYPDVINDP